MIFAQSVLVLQVLLDNAFWTILKEKETKNR